MEGRNFATPWRTVLAVDGTSATGRGVVHVLGGWFDVSMTLIDWQGNFGAINARTVYYTAAELWNV